jgi:hypothetical protein
MSAQEVELMLAGGKEAAMSEVKDNDSATESNILETPRQISGQKRTFTESQISAIKTNDGDIDSLLNTIREKVLNGETLNSFRKEISSIIDLIEKQDPKLERLCDQIGSKIAAIVQKPEPEM